MALKKKSSERVRCKYFFWKVYQRDDRFYADGRSNSPSLGRHFLETTDRDDALAALEILDRVMAVRNGLADRSVLDSESKQALPLEEGRRLYVKHLGRPEVAGGVSASTLKRYRAVFDKYSAYAHEHGISDWNQITDRALNDYLRHLKEEEYADRTLTMEGTVIKQSVAWFISEGLLPEKQRLKTSLAKPRGTTTYSWKPEEVKAMLARCSANPRIQWLGNVLLTLARTGLRIGELLNMEWCDIDFSNGALSVVNDASERIGRRLTKNQESRAIPIHPELILRLKRLRTSCKGTVRVFSGAHGGRITADDVRNALINRVIEPLKKQFPTPAGWQGFEHGRLHSFRHYFVSQAANEGIPVKTLQTWIGHRDSEMIDIYFHLSDKESRRQMNSLSFAAEDFDHVDRDSVA